MKQIAGWRAEEDATGAARDAQANAMTAFDAPPLYEITQPAEVYYGLDDPVVSPEAARSRHPSHLRARRRRSATAVSVPSAAPTPAATAYRGDGISTG